MAAIQLLTESRLALLQLSKSWSALLGMLTYYSTTICVCLWLCMSRVLEYSTTYLGTLCHNRSRVARLQLVSIFLYRSRETTKLGLMLQAMNFIGVSEIF